MLLNIASLVSIDQMIETAAEAATEVILSAPGDGCVGEEKAVEKSPLLS